MKPLNLILTSLICVSILQSCSSYIEPNDLAESILEAFKAKDVDMGLKYILVEDDYNDFYSNSTLEDSEKKRLIAKHGAPEYVQKMKDRFKKRFQEIIDEAEKLGIVWKDVEFEYIEGPKKGKRLYGVESDEIYVFFSHNSSMYKLTLDDCCKTSRGWLMSDEPRLHGPIGN